MVEVGESGRLRMKSDGDGRDTVARDDERFVVASVLEAHASQRCLAARSKFLHTHKHDLYGGAVKRPGAVDLYCP